MLKFPATGCGEYHIVKESYYLIFSHSPLQAVGMRSLFNSGRKADKKELSDELPRVPTKTIEKE